MVVLDTRADWRFTKNVRQIQFLFNMLYLIASTRLLILAAGHRVTTCSVLCGRPVAHAGWI